MKTVLAIETSCDETGIAYVRHTDGGDYISLANALHSQIDAHAPYGGVFPMLAKREHGSNLVGLLAAAQVKALANKVSFENVSFTEEQITTALAHLEREQELMEICKKELEENPEGVFHKKPDIDALVVTAGPGLEPALWVGISFVKALSVLWNIPILPVNHMEGHIASVLLSKKEEVVFPALALLISGGHTELVSISTWGQYEVIGKTRDDAVGEAYDKAARILGLPYPGGPAISKEAEMMRNTFTKADIEAMCVKYSIKLPRPMLKSQDMDFSFSGLKTAVLYLVRDIMKVINIVGAEELPEEILNLICYEFEEAVVDVITGKLNFAYAHNRNIKTLIVAGGVIANSYIRTHIDAWCEDKEIFCFKPEFDLATDNAVMIGLAGLLGIERDLPYVEDFSKLIARGGWKIDEVY
ncbi:MAG: tRNA (adenosine(37)-N6)-threonylcarbamoyltransferase complex transferase subunit TsaD [Patescibacteria group bacterium]